MGNKKIIVKLLKKEQEHKISEMRENLIKKDLDKNKFQQFNKKWLNSFPYKIKSPQKNHRPNKWVLKHIKNESQNIGGRWMKFKFKYIIIIVEHWTRISGSERKKN